MRFDIISLFPQLIAPYLEHGINRRATTASEGHTPAVQVHFWNPRDYAEGEYRRVDDRPFGGGPGMVMLAEPLQQCLQAVRVARTPWDGEASPAPLVYFSPFGQTLSHPLVQQWADRPQGAILLCGRYEGVDQRFIDRHVDVQISLGDFVLSGGEVAAAAFLDAVLRLQPGVLNDAQSHQQDSFNPALSGLLDCPQYTRPVCWDGMDVPAVLLSGNHAHIARWRRQQSLELTATSRPDLLQQADAAGLLDKADRQHLAQTGGVSALKRP